MGFYDYNYCDNVGVTPYVYNVRIINDKIVVDGDKGVSNYELKYSDNVLSLWGDGAVLCDISDVMLIKSIGEVKFDSDRDCIVIQLVLQDGKTEEIDLPLKELINIYKSGAGIDITEEGFITVKVADGDFIKTNTSGELMLDIVFGDGLAVSGNVVSVTGSTSLDVYTKEEVDDKIEEVIEDYDVKIDSLQDELSGVTFNVSALSLQVSKNTEDISGAVDSISQLFEDIDYVSGVVDANTELINVFARDTQRDLAEMSGAISEIKSVIDDLSDEVEAISGSVSALSSVAFDAQEKADANSQSISEVSGSVDALSVLIDKNASDIESVSGQVSVNASDIMSLSTKIDELPNVFETISDATKSHDDIVVGYTELVADTKSSLEGLVSSVSGDITSMCEEIYAKKQSLLDYYTKEEADNKLSDAEEALISGDAEVKREVLQTLTDHTNAMKEEIAEVYLSKSDAEAVYVTSDSAESLFVKAEAYDEDKLKFATKTTTDALDARIDDVQHGLSAVSGNCYGKSEVDSLVSNSVSGLVSSTSLATELNNVKSELNAVIETSSNAAKAEAIKTMHEELDAYKVEVGDKLAEIWAAIRALQN